MSVRHIIISDAHGRPRLIQNALKHSGFNPDKDQLVCAGDCCDRGPTDGALRCHEILEDNDAVMLLGNHEAAHLFGITGIRPYDTDLDPEYQYLLAVGVAEGYFRMAYAVDGILITHAGLSNKLVKLGKLHAGEDDTFMSYHNRGALTADIAAFELNAILDDIVKLDIDKGIIEVLHHPMVVESAYPWWFRPYESYYDIGAHEYCGFYDGFRQVVGHTYFGHFNSKQQRLISDAGVTLIDPCSTRNDGLDGYCRYAIIENGSVELVEGYADEDLLSA